MSAVQNLNDDQRVRWHELCSGAGRDLPYGCRQFLNSKVIYNGEMVVEFIAEWVIMESWVLMTDPENTEGVQHG